MSTTVRATTAVLLVVACGGSPTRPPEIPATPTPLAPATTGPCSAAPAERPADDPLAARRQQIIDELRRIDVELAAIDELLMTREHDAGMSVTDARALALARVAHYQTADVSDTDPFLLRRRAADVYEATSARLKLEPNLGRNHPEMQAAMADEQAARAIFAQQRDIERRAAQAWLDELAKLPTTAKADAVVGARRRGLREVISGDGEVVPTDAPSALVLATEGLLAARRQREQMRRDLGAKHPDMLAAEERVRTAEKGVRDAKLAAAEALAHPASARAIDSSRRAELAGRAVTLRAEYEQLAR
jgi:hypothetical protein